MDIRTKEKSVLQGLAGSHLPPRCLPEPSEAERGQGLAASYTPNQFQIPDWEGPIEFKTMYTGRKSQGGLAPDLAAVFQR